LTNFDKFATASKAPYEYLEKLISRHKQDFQDGEPKDFIELYLQEMKKNEDNSFSSFHGKRGSRFYNRWL